MIRLINVSKSFGNVDAVKDLNLQIESGEIVGFLGPNGAGKTTTMRLITGKYEADRGEIRLLGDPLAKHKRNLLKKVGYLPENAPVYPDMTVLEHLETVGRIQGLSGTDLKKAVTRVVDHCFLGERILHVIADLSKGYKQRVGLAAALIHDPEILILDEPTSGLDPNQIRLFKDLMLRFRGKKTIILSTHILDQVPELCDRVYVMKNGECVFDGPPAAMADQDPHPQQVRLILDQPREVIAPFLSNFRFVSDFKHELRNDDFHGYLLSGDFSDENLSRLFDDLQLGHWRIHSCAPLPRSPERAFAYLTA